MDKQGFVTCNEIKKSLIIHFRNVKEAFGEKAEVTYMTGVNGNIKYLSPILSLTLRRT